MIAQLKKKIFNRRLKKITSSGVVESLVESGAKSQSDKRFSTSWKNLIKDIEKAAKTSEIHSNKPANIRADEWALILSHRTRKSPAAKKGPAKTTAAQKAAAKLSTSRPAKLARKAKTAPTVPTTK